MIIEPGRFAETMNEHWTARLGNVSSEALFKTWLWIGDDFKSHIMDHNNPDRRHLWYILSPPTGTGKTQGTIVYCSMLSTHEIYDHPGALIVTRRIGDCELIARQINDLSLQFGGRETAVAYHTGNKEHPSPEIDLGSLRDFPVLVITHQALARAYDQTTKNSKLRFFMSWQIEERRLRVIDECLDLVQSFNPGLDGLRQTLGIVPQILRDRFPLEVKAIEGAIKELEEIHRHAKEERQDRPDFFCSADISPVDFSDLIKGLNSCGLEEFNTHKERLVDLSETLRRWRYYHNDLGNDTFNSAKLLVEPGANRGCVVMDATAWVNRTYELHADFIIKEPPAYSRNYRNVTIHVSQGHNVGKNSLFSNPNSFPMIFQSLKGKLTGKQVFVVTHKQNEPFVHKIDRDFTLKTQHWGNLDGSNEYRDCDTCVIIGLPYLPGTWPINVFMAMKGAQTTEWLQSPEKRAWGKYPDIKKALELGKMSSDVVQAVNRIRSRKVINNAGDCEKTDVYLMLPARRDEAETLLNDIQSLMPGVVISDDWKVETQKRKQYKPRVSENEAALLNYLQNMSEGVREHRKHVENVLRIPRQTMDRIIKTARDVNSELYEKLTALKVRMETIRVGRAFKTYFLKIHHLTNSI